MRERPSGRLAVKNMVVKKETEDIDIYAPKFKTFSMRVCGQCGMIAKAIGDRCKVCGTTDRFEYHSLAEF